MNHSLCLSLQPLLHSPPPPPPPLLGPTLSRVSPIATSLYHAVICAYQSLFSFIFHSRPRKIPIPDLISDLEQSTWGVFALR